MKRHPPQKRDEGDFSEPIRLIRKFFPEARSRLFQLDIMNAYSLVDAMGDAGLSRDYSCDPHGIPPGFRGTLASKGGWGGEDRAIYARLLEHTGFSPSGRVVIVPDAGATDGEGRMFPRPLICDGQSVPQRLDELDFALFMGSNDAVFVYESGEAMVFDHDQRLFWARSELNRWRGSSPRGGRELP